MITVQEILDRSEKKEKFKHLKGCWDILIKLREIKTGKVYTATAVGLSGKFQDCLCIEKEERWVSIRNFEFPD